LEGAKSDAKTKVFVLSDADFEFKEGERESMLNKLSGKLK
jgi:hypothetical protein